MSECQHVWSVEADCKKCGESAANETARLRAEVERLTTELADTTIHAAIRCNDVERERAEALAQVAVLLKTIESLGVHVVRPSDVLDKARALLDRLQLAEVFIGSLIRLIYASDDKSLQKSAARRLAAWKEGTA